MILSRRVSLDGVQLDSLDNNIIISGFEEDPEDETINTLEMTGRTGSLPVSRHVREKKITVKFHLRNRKTDYNGRNEVLEKITGWAAYGKIMKSTTRPDRKIQVTCTKKPKPTDPRNWTGEYSMTFTAYEKPFWENTTPASAVSDVKASGSVVLEVDGNRDNQIRIDAKNMSGAMINKVNLGCGNYSMAFTELALAANETLVIDYDSQLTQRIRILQTDGKYRSVMDKRTGSDDLKADPGKVTVTFDCDRAIRLTATAAGRYS